MSEESKHADADYVQMGSGRGVVPGSGSGLGDFVNDPDLTQEERDRRIAISLQQQENAAVYDQHKAKRAATLKANEFRTARSNTQTRLANVRKKDNGMLYVPAEYTTENAYVKESGDYLSPHPSVQGGTPQEIADYHLAQHLQKVEQVGAGTAQTLTAIVTEEKEDAEVMARRTARGKNTL